MTIKLHELELKIGEKAGKDKEFMKKLKTDPHSVIEKEGKITLPKGVVVKLHIAEPDTLYIELPPEKDKLKGQSNDLTKIYEEVYNREKKDSLAPEEVYDYLQSSLALKANADKEFRKNLLASPNKVIERLLGKDLIGDAKVKVFESSMNQLHFTVPVNPAELTEATLEKVAGGITHVVPPLLFAATVYPAVRGFSGADEEASFTEVMSKTGDKIANIFS